MRSVGPHLARYNRPKEEVIQHKGDKLKFVTSLARKGLCALLCPGPPMVLRRPWQEQPPWHVICTPLQPGGASPVLLTGHELSVFCNEQSEWGIFRMLCRMPQSWSQRPRLDCWLRLSCGLITFFDHYSLQ